MEDERFKHVLSDPKFRRIPKGERKVKIDKRFRSMFNNKQFKVKYTVDKRGRPLQHSSSEDLKRYYELSSDGEESSDSEGKNVDEELNAKHATDKVISDRIKSKLRDLDVNYARGEGRLCSESSSDDGESEDGEESDFEGIEHKWGELDGDAEETEEVTRRLAACNMDWDRIRALDLMVLFNSFLPPGGCIESIAIYPSEFGKERMKEEEIKGPIELVETKIDDNGGNEEGSKYHMEKLRQYQLNRLKYYYAVIVCDSTNTANKIYTECDGMEYESSATKIDLRFIPNDMTFDDEPKEICNKLPELNRYQPRFFTTTALQQAKVDLTWDETNPDRVEMTQKLSTGKVDDVTDADLENYLALSSEEEKESEDEHDTEEDGDPIHKYKALLQGIEEEEQKKRNRDVEMEVTWGIDLEKKTEGLVKKKLSEKEVKTPFQEYLEKRKQKRKERKQNKLVQNEEDSDVPSDIDMSDPYFAEEFQNGEFKKKKIKQSQEDGNEDEEKQAELELLLMNEDDGKKHFSLKRIQEQESDAKSKKKRKKKQEPQNEDNFHVDVKDARFSALYTSHHFNVDPTDPHYKKTKGMEAIVQEKLKRRIEDQNCGEKGKKKDAELSVLVKSVKRKANAFQSNKK